MTEKLEDLQGKRDRGVPGSQTLIDKFFLQNPKAKRKKEKKKSKRGRR